MKGKWEGKGENWEKLWGGEENGEREKVKGVSLVGRVCGRMRWWTLGMGGKKGWEK